VVDYWRQSQRHTNFSVGYNNRLGRASYSLSAQRSQQRGVGGNGNRQVNSVNLNVNMPLGRAPRAARLDSSLRRGSDGNQALGLRASGAFGAQQAWNYSVGVSQEGKGSDSVDAYTGYAGERGMANVGFSRGRGYASLSLGASGGAVLHRGGVVLSRQLGDTVAVVHVPGGKGADLGAGGVRSNRSGYALVPQLSPFRRNPITVDPKGLPLEVELLQGSTTVVPTAGAIVKAVLATRIGRNALIEAPQVDGQPLPFGVDVLDENGVVVGVVGQASRLWVRGIGTHGRLSVQWGGETVQRCEIDYDTRTAEPGALQAATCRPAALAVVSPSPP